MNSSRNQPLVAHKLVASVAREAAGQMYERVMSDNSVRAEWKRQHPGMSEKALIKAFVKRYAPDCVHFARATLAAMLARPGLDQSTKDDISEALILDSQIPGRLSHHDAEMRVRDQLLKGANDV